MAKRLPDTGKTTSSDYQPHCPQFVQGMQPFRRDGFTGSI